MRNTFIFLLLTVLVYPHSGRLDSDGGHTNQLNGKYHLHTGEDTSANSLDRRIRIQILKYDAPHSWGQSFSSIKRCESKIKHLAKENKGLDYSYVCAIK